MAVLSHQANVYWYVQYDKLWIQAHPLARITKGPKMNLDKILINTLRVCATLIMSLFALLASIHMIKLIIYALS